MKNLKIKLSSGSTRKSSEGKKRGRKPFVNEGSLSVGTDGGEVVLVATGGKAPQGGERVTTIRLSAEQVEQVASALNAQVQTASAQAEALQDLADAQAKLDALNGQPALKVKAPEAKAEKKAPKAKAEKKAPKAKAKGKK